MLEKSITLLSYVKTVAHAIIFKKPERVANESNTDSFYGKGRYIEQTEF